MRRDRELLWDKDIDRKDVARNGENQQDRNQYPCADLFDPIHLFVAETHIANSMEYRDSEQERKHTEHHAIRQKRLRDLAVSQMEAHPPDAASGTVNAE